MNQRREIETPFNKAPVVRVVAALLMVISILAALTRITTQLLRVRSLKLDDHLTVVSTKGMTQATHSTEVFRSWPLLSPLWSFSKVQMVLANMMTVCMIARFRLSSRQVYNFGIETRHESSRGSEYAAHILFIAVLHFAKLSVAVTIWNMAPHNRRCAAVATSAAIVLWAVSATITVLFQCYFPEPWNYSTGQCIHRVRTWNHLDEGSVVAPIAAFWTYYSIGNIATDLAITCIMVELVRNVQTSRSKKALVIGVFGSRLFIIPAVICHIYFFNRAVNSSDSAFDTFNMWQPTIIMQVIQCLNIVTTCIPYLKPFLDSLESGRMSTGDLLQTINANSGSSKSGPGSGQTSGNRGNSRDIAPAGAVTSAASHRQHKIYELVQIPPKLKGATATAVAMQDRHSASWDRQSHTSQTVLVQQTWRVDIERKDSTAE
ncbi:Uncharacterized protein TPAR_00654 [Tolypocladium paradoxum]|uniref:Rhodopsin domain-containing protein n=1 Tax=Tolypocladium paradoxum TaxID=94208 RepID=A0A2S4L9M1_9HYPO|nr:Uncharacterized protein TPAR_00654 [Tolypocladium paradoxum]